MRLRVYDVDTYLVSSDGDQWYLVDPSENNGIGFCSCLDWYNRCQPKISNKEAGRKRCKHILFVLEVLKELQKRRTN